MILLVPVVLALIAQARPVGCRCVLRYAVRDAARHRTRTVPAVAAVAATVAGVVALGIGVTSDDAENEATYQPSVAAGVGVVTAYDPDVSWQALRERARPGAAGRHRDRAAGAGRRRKLLRGVGPGSRDRARTPPAARSAPASWSPTTSLPVGLLGVARRDVPRAEQMLEAGRHGRVRLSRPLGRRGHRDRGPALLRPGHRRGHRDPPRGGAGCVREADRPVGRSSRCLSTAAAEQLGAEPATVALAVTGSRVRAAGGGRQRGAWPRSPSPRRSTSSAATRPTTRR